MNTRKSILILSSALLASLYVLTVFDLPAGYLFEFKKMVAVTSQEAELNFKLQPARHLLKIKHENKPGIAKKVFINNQKILPFKVRKKQIETDWFYIEPGQVKGDDVLSVKFNGVFPSDLDVRLNNFISPPQDNISDDIFILFKSPASMPHFNLFRWASVFFLAFGFLYLSAFFLDKRRLNSIFYISRGSAPFVIFMITVNIVNLLPFNPYRLYFGPFFFLAVFMLSYFLILILAGPVKDGLS
jgi:hypothetical protein